MKLSYKITIESEDLIMDKNINNYNVIEKDGILVKNKIDKGMMNLHNKPFMELDKNELQREIDYLWGQYDFISQCEELRHDFKTKKAKYLWDQIDLFTKRYISLSIISVGENMDKISDEMRGMRKEWQKQRV